MCNELTNKEKKALKSIPIGANANNNQTVKYNSLTGKFEFADLPTGSGFDQANDYSPTGAWDFGQIPTVAGTLIILKSDLDDYATKQALTSGLATKADASALSAYATTSALASGLATKADASALSAYATNSALSSGLAGKADTSALAAYATTSALSSGLAGKADASALSSYVAKTGNETINGTKLFSQIINTNQGLGMKYSTAPTGEASITTLFADATGRLSWRNGTGFTRNFDAGSITANRSWTMPDADTTLAGLSVAQTFTQLQTFQRAIANNSGTNTNFGINVNYSITNTGGTNTVNGLFVNGTETSMTGTTHHLVEIQRNSTSFFRVTNANGYPLVALNNTSLFALSGGSTIICAPTSGYARIMSQDLGTNWIIFRNGFIAIGTNENNLNPALKRNGTGLQARLADDSAFTTIQGILQTDNAFVSAPSVSVSGYVTIKDSTGTNIKVMVTAGG